MGAGLTYKRSSRASRRHNAVLAPCVVSKRPMRTGQRDSSIELQCFSATLRLHLQLRPIIRNRISMRAFRLSVAAFLLAIASAQPALSNQQLSEMIDLTFTSEFLPYLQLRACGYEVQADQLKSAVLDKIIYHPDFDARDVGKLMRHWDQFMSRQDCLMGAGVYPQTVPCGVHKRSEEECADALQMGSDAIQRLDSSD